MGLRVIVSDDVQQSGSSPNKKFAVYFFTEGSVGAGEQDAMQTETDRDILAKSDAMSIDLHYCYHPVGAKWGVTTTNPTRAQLGPFLTGVRCTRLKYWCRPRHCHF